MFPTLLAHIPVIYVTRPDEDWCAVIAGALGGDIIMLEPGEYVGGCEIDALVADKKGERTILQSFYPDTPAVIRAPETGEASLSVSGQALVMLQLVFEGGAPGQAHIELESMDEFTLRRTHMRGDVDAGVRLVGSTGQVRIDNTIFEGLPEALDLDCCSLSGLELDRNVIDGGGISVSADVEGLIRDTTVLGAPDVALSWAGGAPLTLDGAVLQGSPAARVTGPAHIGNTFLLGRPVALDQRGAAVSVSASTLLGDVVGNPAFASCAVSPPPANLPEGSVGCEDPSVCWTDPQGGDLTPRPDGPLSGAGLPVEGFERDWCDADRPALPTAGALEAGLRTPGPFVAEARGTTPCDELGPPAPEDSGDTGLPTEPPPEPGEPEPGCACGTESAPQATWLSLLLGLASVLRRGSGGASRSR